jgi:Na+-transporting methylmalonyl-CoA/oxaloacetate decarboxylase gamma subunit
MLSHIGERARIIGITIVITVLYLLLQHVWLGMTGLLSGQSFLERPSAAELEQQAKMVAESSKDALQAAPASSRHDIWHLGFHLGYVSEFVGSCAMSAEEVQAKARQLTEPVLVEANRLAQSLRLGAVNPLFTQTLDDFARLTNRIEADEIGLAERINRTYSPYHHHLFCWGCISAPKRLAFKAAAVKYLCLPARRSGYTRP